MTEGNNNQIAKKVISDNPKNNFKPNQFVKTVLEQIDIFVIAFAIIILVTFFAVRICTVNGDSMRDTLVDNEPIFVENIFYTPKRGDIVVFHQTGPMENDFNEPIVKRVIGIAGDTVKIEHFKDTMRVTITDAEGNVTILDENYIRYDYPSYPDSTTYVEEGTIFVMGDNRSHSGDSRSNKIGLVDTRRVIGRVFFKLGSDFGTVD